MKLKYIVGLIILLIIVITITFIYNKLSHVSYKIEGIRGYSLSIFESKKRNTFLNEYNVEVNSTIDINIKEAFIEKGFGYGENFNITNSNYYGNQKKNYQIILVIEDYKELIDYSMRWYIKKEEERFFFINYVKNILSCDIDSSFISDTLTFKIYEGEILASNKIIGEIFLTKNPI
ncbi:MAG: hypothetical protein KAT68_15200 [Bacteroidales bacterium]|nr:hypothetical protein [Bacteroidales bacterium]